MNDNINGRKTTISELKMMRVGIHGIDKKLNRMKNNMNMIENEKMIEIKCSSYLAPDKDTLGYARMIHPHVVTMKTINAILWLIFMLSIPTEKYNENY